MITLLGAEKFLCRGWINLHKLDLSRLIESGQTLTIVLSDGAFDVQKLPGDVRVVSSVQRTFDDMGLVTMRVLIRSV